MIVTRSWLEEFVGLEKITDQEICDALNSIGLELDSYERFEMPQGVVVGKILSCNKHPDADKLNVCEVDIGGSVEQIVCGAANVVDATYVAVATVGAVLPGDFKIKPAKLRGVESMGMICSSGELGLPEMGKGIMQLDQSIGELKAGRWLGEYECFTDSLFEIELTANRGDCLSIYGVARDLSAYFELSMSAIEPLEPQTYIGGIGKQLTLRQSDCKGVALSYGISVVEEFSLPFAMRLRLAMVDSDKSEPLESLLAYVTHTTGVLMRAYDAQKLTEQERIELSLESKSDGLVSVKSRDVVLSHVGIDCNKEYAASASAMVLFEASYIAPDLVSQAQHETKMETDELYYKSSRGSNPQLDLGKSLLRNILVQHSESSFYEGYVTTETLGEKRELSVDLDRLYSIIGMPIDSSRVVGILKRLGFEVRMASEQKMALVVPNFRHDIINIQDVAEEILRMVSIDSIENLPMQIVQQNKENEALREFRFKKQLRNHAAAAGFFESVSYLFSQRSLLEELGFEVVDASLELLNPIIDELDTLRTTMLANMLLALKRNRSYSIRSIRLFEQGVVFDSKRQEREMIAFGITGSAESERVSNAGKADSVSFDSFVQQVALAIGDFELTVDKDPVALFHPYQSAKIVINNVECGRLGRVHPVVEERFGLEQSYLCELSLEALKRSKVEVGEISSFQGTYKDLSIVVKKSLPYEEIKAAIDALGLPLLKRFYPIDLYSDESLGDSHSLSMRFYLQSMQETLVVEQIDEVMKRILASLEEKFGAQLR